MPQLITTNFHDLLSKLENHKPLHNLISAFLSDGNKYALFLDSFCEFGQNFKPFVATEPSRVSDALSNSLTKLGNSGITLQSYLVFKVADKATHINMAQLTSSTDQGVVDVFTIEGASVTLVKAISISLHYYSNGIFSLIEDPSSVIKSHVSADTLHALGIDTVIADNSYLIFGVRF